MRGRKVREQSAWTGHLTSMTQKLEGDPRRRYALGRTKTSVVTEADLPLMREALRTTLPRVQAH